jgi:hypothetical protein
MTTITAFTPNVSQNFAFEPTLDGQVYNVVITWSLFGQRWLVNCYDLSGVLVFARPLRSSPNNADINIAAGYFKTSTLIYREQTRNFEVTP